MPESPPPGVIGDVVGGRQETLTPEAIEAILADFRSWLGTALAPSPPAEHGAAGEQAAEPLDLHTLLSHLVALRQEVNLQTKAVRGQQEQNAETLRQLGQALQTLRQAQNGGDQTGQQAKEELLRPVLKTLVDVHDALWLAEREVRRVTQNVLPELENFPVAPEPEAEASFLGRLFGRRAAPRAKHSEEQASLMSESAERIRNMLGSLLTGYTMSLNRLERTLEQAGLEQIPCEGEAFDPELMEVVEVVAGSGLPAGEVVEEVRRGYLWNGRIFRYAQARVAKD
jgi:molecular chaperone GrpE